MRKVRILHTADMHLGANVSMFDPNTNISRKKEILQSAMKVFEASRDVDVTILAGDIFDGAVCNPDITDEFISCVKKASDTRFFYACGNHDFYDSTTIKYLLDNCPDNLHIFSADGEFVELKELNTRVYGVSFSSSYCSDSLIKKFSKTDDSYINILCIHGELTESGNSIYNPISLSLTETLGFDYAALGHIHSFSGIKRFSDLSYAYCGVHEPNGFDECGKKGYIVGDVSKSHTSLSFVPVSKREYIDDCIDITGINSDAQLIRIIEEKCIDPQNICRFELVGENTLRHGIVPESIENQINIFYLSVSDSTTDVSDFERLADSVSLKGLCAGEIKKRLECAELKDEQKIIKAGKLLLDILEGRSVNFDY